MEYLKIDIKIKNGTLEFIGICIYFLGTPKIYIMSV